MPENLSSERTLDDWSIATLDLDAYLTRIGYTGPRDATEATLTELYRLHLAAIRFENFDVFLRGGVAVDLESIQEKIVFRGRGGYCYEQAQLFAAVLERLGFTVQRMLARVGPDGGPARARTHLTLRVQSGTGVWLADPGFGSSPPGPLGCAGTTPAARRRCTAGSTRSPPTRRTATRSGSSASTRRESGSPCTAGKMLRAHPIDVVLSNHYTSTHPDSWFTSLPILSAATPTRSDRSSAGPTRSSAPATSRSAAS